MKFAPFALALSLVAPAFGDAPAGQGSAPPRPEA
jgi:hypothetical protein